MLVFIMIAKKITANSGHKPTTTSVVFGNLPDNVFLEVLEALGALDLENFG